MLKHIRKFFDDHLMPTVTDEAGNQTSTSQGIAYATAALLIELGKSDFDEDTSERTLMLSMLQETFALSTDQLEELVNLAESGTQDASDLFQFTTLVNEHYSNEMKILLLENLWKMAFADGRLDKYEEQFIRRIAGLIHLAPAEFMKTRMRVKLAQDE